MDKLMGTSAVFALVFAGVLAASPAFGQEVPTLPGGANSLKEVHGDWTVDCGPKSKADAAIACTVSQEQQDLKSRRRVLAIALNPAEGGGGRGTLVMPFGLGLAAGVTLAIDDGPVTNPAAYRTCLPAGCLVPLEWPAATIIGLRTGKKLILEATTDDGKPAPFSISLNGFGSALDRAVELTGTR